MYALSPRNRVRSARVIGTTVSHYKVTSKLGAGGMGEVWRAEDTKLGRDVALKVLPASVASDPERLARFEREARALAAFSHPNIAGIHGLEEADGQRFLVMEVAEGQTLADRLARGPLPVEEAVRVALQIAEALEVAHEKGIVHRDLKPGNVMVSPEGRVKVLDFGLAKALGAHPLSGGSGVDASHSPTLAMTQAGVLLGTAGYMSPEQARGKAVDRRADIWSFGCVLYEMLAGHRAFDGETVTDVLGAIVHKEADLARLPAHVPTRMRQLLQQCLQKDASRRLQSIGDARVALQEWLENPKAAEPPTSSTAPAGLRWLPWAAAVVAGALGLLAGATLLGRRGAPPEPVRRFEVNLTEDSVFSRLGSGLVASPDGRSIVYTTGQEGETQRLVLRPLDRFQETVLASGVSAAGTYNPFFSPDGEWLGFVTPRELKKISVTGGAPITLAAVERSRGATWGKDGSIVFAPAVFSGLSRIPAAGGTAEPLTKLDEARGEKTHRWPQWLPDGRSVLFTVRGDGSPDYEGASIEVVRVDTGERKVIHRGGYYARYVPTGHVLYVQNGTLFALPFDAERLEAKGSQMPVLEDLETNPAEGSAQYGVSDNGLLTYLPRAEGLAPFTIATTDREGRAQPLWKAPGIYGGPRLSPDGRSLVVSVQRDGNWDVWVYDLDREVATRITFGERYDADPVWSPDGRWIAYESEVDGKDGVFRKRADGTGDAEVVLGPGTMTFPAPTSWSPDGRLLMFQPDGGGGRSDLYVVEADGRGKPEPVMKTQYDESGGAFSPDGRWVAYTSDETGRREVFVTSFPPGGGKWQISDGGGAQAKWRRDGRELFFRSDEGVMSARVSAEGSSLRAGKPDLVFRGPFLGGLRGLLLPGFNFPDYDVSGDGRRFVVFTGGGSKRSAARARVVLNWFEELKRLTGSVGH
jgi:Tol biopolymer transport system component